MISRQGLPQKHNWMCTRLKSEVLADIWVRFPAGATLLLYKYKIENGSSIQKKKRDSLEKISREKQVKRACQQV